MMGNKSFIILFVIFLLSVVTVISCTVLTKTIIDNKELLIEILTNILNQIFDALVEKLEKPSGNLPEDISRVLSSHEIIDNANYIHNLVRTCVTQTIESYPGQ